MTRFKLGITALSAALTAVGGVLYAQYITYVNPETLAASASPCASYSRSSWAACLAAGSHGRHSLTIALAEYLRVIFGVKLIGMAETIYGLLLVLFIIFCPRGSTERARPLDASESPGAGATAEATMATRSWTSFPDTEPPKAAVELAERVEGDGGHVLALYREPSAITGRSSVCCRSPGSKRAPTSATFHPPRQRLTKP